ATVFLPSPVRGCGRRGPLQGAQINYPGRADPSRCRPAAAVPTVAAQPAADAGDGRRRFPARRVSRPARKAPGKAAMKHFFLAAGVVGLCGAITPAQWQVQAVGTEADFRGLCVVSPDIAWVSGTKGTYARTTDGGRSWSVGTVLGAEKLDFRDVAAFGER